MDSAIKLMGISYEGSDYSKGIIIFLIGAIISVLIIYVYVSLRKRTFNCDVLSKNKISSTIRPISSTTPSYNSMLKQCHIKTAYNCCCTGDFRNDYVDYCALINCAKQGFRALDFQIFSVDGLPVVSESTTTNKNYKEMFNHLPFNDTMSAVKRYFIQDSTNCPNINDPLFLIFRINSNNIDIFTTMYNSINALFGSANSSGNKLYVPSNSTDINTVKIKDMCGKVVIVVDVTGLTNFESSKLFKITGLKLGTLRNQIYRENDVMSTVINDSTFIAKFTNDVCALYPAISSSSDNYDFVTSGINTGIQFIGLNAQTNDVYLTSYNSNYFGNYSIITKTV